MRRSGFTSRGATVSAVALVAVILSTAVRSQPTAPPQQADAGQPALRDPSVIRMSVDLVQIDAVVTDRQDRHVTDLAIGDFEVLQDGRPQAISTFTYVAAGSRPPQELQSKSPGLSNPAPTGAPAPPLARDQVRRTMAIVVDDLSLSFQSIARVRSVLRRFIDEQMRPGDLVAILRTGAGMGALQQFTADRRLLHAAVEGIRWNMEARVAPFEAATGIDSRLDDLEKEFATASTLGAVQYVIRGVAQLPGRKSILLLSDGFRLTDADMKYGRILDMVRSIVTATHRAGVVLYGIDLRGLVTTAPSAADGTAADAVDLAGRRTRELASTQEGADVLARETGGFLITDTNDLGGALRRVVDDQQGYYLLGYVPDSSTFSARNPKFHSLTVRVKREGLRVRSRRGFVGQAETQADTPVNRMLAAVTSPFAGGDIRLRLSSFFRQIDSLGSAVLSMMHVDARDIAFSEEADGTRVAGVEVLAMTFGENGQVADQLSQRYTVRLTAERYAKAIQAGFVYSMRVPVKRPGPYQLRIALRDVSSGRIGSASHFIAIPDVKKRNLLLSGLLVQSVPAASRAAGTLDEVDPDGTVAVRRFHQGASAHYFSSVYNAHRTAAGLSQVESEIRLFREGVLVFTSGPHPVQQTPGSQDLSASGVLQLGAGMPPGSYILELTVIDRLEKKQSRATQTIDFEVIE